MGSFTPTDQQRQVIHDMGRRHSFVVQAGAGSGKTTTLVEGARQVSQVSHGRAKGLYLAYGKDIVKDSRGKFPNPHVCKTAHAVAFAAIGRDYAHRLNGFGSVQPWQIANFLGLREFTSHDTSLTIRAKACASLAMRGVKRYCGSTDENLEFRHIPLPTGVDGVIGEELREYLLPAARRIWEDAKSTTGALRFVPDYYLKMFALAHPRLPYDAIWLDEAQDADPVILQIFLEQRHAQRIAVGDSAQAIYEWRGAKDALDHIERLGAPVLELSRSFRFGPDLADEANKWLDLLNARIRIIGDPQQDTKVRIGGVDRDQRHAVLCRTNAGVLQEVIGYLDEGRATAMVGGGREIIALAEACDALIHGKRPDHPTLTAFDSWNRFVEYVESPDCDDPSLKLVLKMIDTHGAETIISMLKNCAEERDAQVVVSTAHRAKGREWPNVIIGGDFPEPVPTKTNPDGNIRPADMRLAYVAVTRARKLLDRSGLAWVDNRV